MTDTPDSPHAPPTPSVDANPPDLPTQRSVEATGPADGVAGRDRRRSAGVQVALVVVGFGFGLILVLALRPGGTTEALLNARQSEVLAVLDSLTTQRDLLETELAEVTRARDQLIAGSSAEALAQAEATLADYSILAGTAPAIGPGIVMVITDPAATIGATTFLDGIQELRDAGAEAIQIQSERVIASTWFGDDVNGIVISGTPVASPYTIRVIGEPATLETAMRIPGGFIRSVEAAGAVVTVDQQADVLIEAVVPTAVPEYAREQRS